MNKPFLAPALALLALASGTAAQAQQQACVDANDLGDAVLYAMPIAYDAVGTACSKQLTRDGFMARGGDAFIAKFRSHQDKAWPGAFRLLKTFMAKDAGGQGASGTDMTAMIASLPEESLRPFVDGLVGQMIAGEIKPESCSKIERGMELLSPLPVENVAGLMTFIAELADLKDPKICSAAPARKSR
ncbi:hypothetical protein [Erythrobacter tepidarius]|uniref:hypothetical protein n=1 Tax=Erythrobacter tepidarius TaxID=60454 RepID=UPI000A388337|nr:hypothetical protein [Erythrobacter tepidarius]